MSVPDTAEFENNDETGLLDVSKDDDEELLEKVDETENELNDITDEEQVDEDQSNEDEQLEEDTTTIMNEQPGEEFESENIENEEFDEEILEDDQQEEQEQEEQEEQEQEPQLEDLPAENEELEVEEIQKVTTEQPEIAQLQKEVEELSRQNEKLPILPDDHEEEEEEEEEQHHVHKHGAGIPQIFVCTQDEKDRSLQMESYCCQQIQIPPMLPNILKTFTKSVIKTQPRDLLQWSVAYFRAMATGQIPPVKERLEYPTVESPCGLTKGLLRVLNKQLGKNQLVTTVELRDKWTSLCLNGEELKTLLLANGLEDQFEWTKFIAIAAKSIVNDHVVEGMVVFCETMTEQPDGVDPYIPYELFAEAYTFLASQLDVTMIQAEEVCHFLRDLAKANFGLVGPKDFMAVECPPLC